MIQKRIERRIIDRHIAPSATLTDYLQQFGYDAGQIRNPEPVAPTTDGTDEGYFLFVGRLSAEKGVNVLLDAVETLSREAPETSVKIAGSGPLQSELRSRVENGGGDVAELLGYVSEDRKRELYDGARALIVPSVWMENYPTVVLEAMAHGKPVIGSDRGGIGEMIEHRYNGLLYPAIDADALADRIRTLADQPSMAATLGDNGREWLQNESGFDTFGTEIENLFGELAGGH
jgi:glycosyltransferase involved in cell wall biosynthesis